MGIEFLMIIIKIIFEGNLRDIGYLTKLTDRIDFKGLSVFRKKDSFNQINILDILEKIRVF